MSDCKHENMPPPGSPGTACGCTLCPDCGYRITCYGYAGPDPYLPIEEGLDLSNLKAEFSAQVEINWPALYLAAYTDETLLAEVRRRGLKIEEG